MTAGTFVTLNPWLERDLLAIYVCHGSKIEKQVFLAYTFLSLDLRVRVPYKSEHFNTGICPIVRIEVINRNQSQHTILVCLFVWKESIAVHRLCLVLLIEVINRST